MIDKFGFVTLLKKGSNQPSGVFLWHISKIIPKTHANISRVLVTVTAMINFVEVALNRPVDCCSAGLSGGS